MWGCCVWVFQGSLLIMLPVLPAVNLGLLEKNRVVAALVWWVHVYPQLGQDGNSIGTHHFSPWDHQVTFTLPLYFFLLSELCLWPLHYLTSAEEASSECCNCLCGLLEFNTLVLVFLHTTDVITSSFCYLKQSPTSVCLTSAVQPDTESLSSLL